MDQTNSTRSIPNNEVTNDRAFVRVPTYNASSFFRQSYDKITASSWTKLFVLVSVLQLFVVVALEANVLVRNTGFRKTLMDEELIYKNVTDSTCYLRPSVTRMQLIMEENVIFMLFQIFQLWFCINAIYDENTIQIITISVINFLCALYGIVQTLEIKRWLSVLGSDCLPGSYLEPAYATHDVPLVAILVVFASIMAFISWKLYLEFGWNIYKKIGADVKIQKIYKTMLIFVMFIKLSLFFVIISAIEIFLAFTEAVYTETSTMTSQIPRNVYFFHLGVTILILVLVNLGYQSLKREWRVGMVVYLVLSTLALVDFGIIFKYSLQDVSNVTKTWYFFIVFIAVAIIVSFITWVWGVFAFFNFGKGLLKNANETPRKDDVESGQQIPDKFTIDDED